MFAASEKPEEGHQVVSLRVEAQTHLGYAER